ncbi:MAG: DEAD/DEAH box helicase [Planctomycetia bacterium]|nr:DEAD/DEAH box helicase [Planctomycetia bacterium]
MIILHGSFESGRVLLWGETPPPPLPHAPRKGRTARRKTTAALPYGADHATLAAVLKDVLPSVPPATAQASSVWLPTVAGQPIPSSPLIADAPESKQPPRLAPWQVAVWQLPADQAIDLLCACRGKETLAAGVSIGKSLAFWAAALPLAGALVARGQFLPGIEQTPDGWRACWRPILMGLDPQRLTQLAAAMPAACRAANGADAAPEQPAGAVLGDFVARMVDALVRAAPPAPAAPRLPGTRRRPPAPAFESLHDQWLHALRAADGGLTGTDAELAALADHVNDWQRPVTLAAAAPFRLCFRLEEPPTETPARPASENAPWHVRYLLQAQHDPSLLVPAEQAWKPRGATGALLQRDGFAPREYLLAALGQAAALCPPVEASLQNAAPTNFPADATAAHRFLTESSLLLEQAGFGVILPAWWTRTGTKHRLSVTAQVKSPKSQSSGLGLRLDEIVQFDWQVALGEEPLSLAELQALARLKQPLVRVRGQWVQVNAEEIQAALDFWKTKGEAEATVRQVLQMALGRADPPGGLAFGGVQATGWVGQLFDQLEGRATFEELPPPAGFRGTLRPYQQRGYSWLAFLRRWGLGACLADDMGLGKTVQTLALLERAWHENGQRPTLLVCPTSVMGNWKKEAERFTPGLPVLIHHGVQRRRGAGFVQEAERQALVICSYALLHRDAAHLAKVRWAGIVLDEAQNIKNPETKQARAARALPADLRIALTGTPVENHVGDLWSICEFLNPGFLGGPAEFRRRFQIPIQAGRDPEAAARLKRLTGPFVLRRLKTDPSIISDLPDKLEMKVYCNLTKEQASLYAAVVAELSKDLNRADGIQRKGVVLAALSKLKQVCDHPAQFLGDASTIAGRSGKLARLTEMLDELAQASGRALIFTQFSEMGGIIQTHLQETFGQEVPFLHGGLTPKQRDRLVARFQEPDGPRCFILSLKAGGTGLNLTAANHVFHFDRWWNPAVENQATDRAFRIGQRRNVQVHKFLCVGTLEEKIDEMLERKKDVAARVVGAGEAWLTELSNDQLKELVTLRKEALGH